MAKTQLGELGLNLVPDPFLERFRLKPDTPVVVYEAPEAPPVIRTRPYKRAMLLVRLATLCLAPLTDAEAARLAAMADGWVRAPRYRRHIHAMIAWYRLRRRALDRRTRSEITSLLGPADTPRMADDLLALASARGHTLTAKSLWQLDRILTIMGYPQGQVHTLLHRACGGAGAPALATVQAETHRVQALLSRVFGQEEKVEDMPQPQATPTSELAPDPFLATLLSREVWTLDELAPHADGKPLRAVEEANDRAFDLLGDTVADVEGSSVYVTTAYAPQLLGTGKNAS